MIAASPSYAKMSTISVSCFRMPLNAGVGSRVDTNTANDAVIASYAKVKLICQIISYLGISATAGLSVFDLLFKEQHNKIEGEPQPKLNRAGRTHLIAFLAISLCTVASTIFKDLADSKLDSMSKEKAQAELRQALGGDIKTITNDALAPAVTELASSISGQATALNTSIVKSESSLNGALKDTGLTIQEIIAENSDEAATANLHIRKFDIVAMLPTYLKRPPIPSKRFARWKQLSDAHCGVEKLAADDAVACKMMERQLNQLDPLQNFIEMIDPSDSSDVMFFFTMRSTSVDLYVRADCDPFSYPKDAHPKYSDCVDISASEGPHGSSFNVSDAQILPPAVTVSETNISTDVENKPSENLFGKDLDFESFSIFVRHPDEKTLRNMPDYIRVVVSLSPAGASESRPINRYYKLKLRKQEPPSFPPQSRRVSYLKQ